MDSHIIILGWYRRPSMFIMKHYSFIIWQQTTHIFPFHLVTLFRIVHSNTSSRVIINMIADVIVVVKRSLTLQDGSHLCFVLPAISPPRTLSADFLFLKTEALAPQDVEIYLPYHVGSGRERLSQTATEPETRWTASVRKQAI